ncbi:MAG: peptidase S8 [Runella slithyformis]|nr:MAG: peptidase S8 [Runella slithyformis]
MKKISLFVCFVLLSSAVFGQNKYWIYFKDKPTGAAPSVSSQTLKNRAAQGLSAFDESDLPLQLAYLRPFAQHAIQIQNTSRWLNAATAVLDARQLALVKSWSFVKNIQPINGQFYVANVQPVKRAMLAPVMTQVQAEEFKKLGLTGKGITIGVIDAGFYEATNNGALKPLFERNAILDQRDYVNPAHTPQFFSAPESFSDFHGTEVMTAISGNNRTEGVQYGLATDAHFYLARTDHGLREWRGEEDNWIAAMEWMDSLGVRLINTSLGYAKGFSNPAENYEPAQMDGQTSAISKAAQMAVDKKGILLVVSAGNEGDDPNWQIISTPADAQGVLAIGATNQKLWSKIGYSSVGPEFLPYLKPNVSCFSLYGTSLSAPVITGFAACLMQANPALTNREIRAIIEKSAHLYPYGNNYVGYGVPLASRALALIQNPDLVAQTARQVKVTGTAYNLKLPENETVTVFHKKNVTHVLVQEALRAREGQITIKRRNGETQTTIDLKTEVIELIWE